MKILLCLAIFFIGSNCQQSVTKQKENRIVRPCSTSDIDCIRRYFGDHAQCRVTHGPVPDPMYFKHTYAFLPAANMTLTSDDFYRTNLNGRIEEFYINKETDKLLIALEFKNLTIYSNNSYLAYHRRAKEPIINKTTLRIFIERIINEMPSKFISLN
ncbi:uncharacterized protein LOC121726044 [Aricia agestis]|uniref:uncharacterized protein LOC121726044 n=1 Tax=Aricia agestis TaxID=91739 RepID=UPI001C206815|nr:uncharacterized protein LOC121726044 [Aricia agestis]